MSQNSYLQPGEKLTAWISFGCYLALKEVWIRGITHQPHLLTISSYEEKYLSDPAWEVCIWSLSKFIDKVAHIDKGEQEPEIWHSTVGVPKSDCTKQSKTMRIVNWERNITWWQHYAQPKFPRLIKLSLQTSNISNLIATPAFLL